MLTMQDAEKALSLVMTTYGGIIDPVFNGRKASDIFRFCTEPEFALYFQMTYVTAFKKANATLIPDLITPDQINGFVNAEADYDARRIHIPKREGILFGTLVHESLHYVSHKSFYPEFYLQAGFRPFQVEGATEFFTRFCRTSLHSRRNYQANFQRTLSWLGASKANLTRMAGFMFQGKVTDLDAIQP